MQSMQNATKGGTYAYSIFISFFCFFSISFFAPKKIDKALRCAKRKGKKIRCIFLSLMAMQYNDRAFFPPNFSLQLFTTIYQETRGQKNMSVCTLCIICLQILSIFFYTRFFFFSFSAEFSANFETNIIPLKE